MRSLRFEGDVRELELKVQITNGDELLTSGAAVTCMAAMWMSSSYRCRPKMIGVPNSNADLSAAVHQGKVLASKRVNTKLYEMMSRLC